MKGYAMKNIYSVFCLLIITVLLCATPAQAGTKVVLFNGTALTALGTSTSEALSIDTVAPGAEWQYVLRVVSSTGGQVGLRYVVGETQTGAYVTPADGGQLTTFQGEGEKSDTFKPGLGEKIKFIVDEQAGYTATVYLIINY